MELEFHSPAGSTEVTEKHAPRLSSLDGKRIGFLSNGDWQAYRSLPMLREHLASDHPGTTLLPVDAFPEGTEVMSEDSTIEQVISSGVDAVVIGNAACGACSTACAVAAAKLEIAGVPTVIVAREEFVGVVRNAASGLGLPADLPMVTFPIDLFIPDSNLTPMAEARHEIWGRLVSWTSAAGLDGDSPMLSVSGDGTEDLYTKANNLFVANHWGDGLPMWPATRERVDWILSGAVDSRDLVLGKFPPRGGVVTVESCAIALAMSGGRPEYLPVLIASVDAILDPGSNSEQMQATSAGTFPVIIVNGPVGKQIRLNSGFGCLGPNPQYPAGTSIGRAIRQLQQNLGGAMPGTGTMAPWGASRITNAVFAEDEEGMPAGWASFATQRHGYAEGTNAISFFWATGASNVLRRGAKEESLEEDAIQGLKRIATYLAASNAHYAIGYEHGTPGAVLITRAVARQLDAAGWNQQDIRDFLWAESRIPLTVLKENGTAPWIELSGGPAASDSLALDPWPIASKPDNLALVVAGGDHPTHAFWLQAIARNVVGREVRLPDAFDGLLREADTDLGCADDVCAI